MECGKRNSNIELLRILLMFMVITLHFNNQEMGGAINIVKNYPSSFFLLNFFESLSICAVNCFMIISGYFLAYNGKIKLGKIIDLLLIVIFYRVLDYCCILIIKQESFSIYYFIVSIIPINYFAIFYIVSYIFSPFLVSLLNNLSGKKIIYLMVFSIFLFVVWPTLTDIGNNILKSSIFDGISTISNKGNCAGYTIIQFFLDMLIGMYIRRFKINPKTWKLLIVFFMSSLLLTIGSYYFSSLYNYCSLFTVVNAICLFLLFNKFSFNNNFINYISKSVFSVYCIHTMSLPIFFWKKYLITSNHINGVGTTLLWMLVSVFVMYFACLIISIIFRNTFGLIKEKISLKCPVLIIIDE